MAGGHGGGGHEKPKAHKPPGGGGGGHGGSHGGGGGGGGSTPELGEILETTTKVAEYGTHALLPYKEMGGALWAKLTKEGVAAKAGIMDAGWHGVVTATALSFGWEMLRYVASKAAA